MNTESAGILLPPSGDILNKGNTLRLKNWGEYRVWDAMKDRCRRPGATHYERYGGRGIKVCERWATSFESFLADMGQRPSTKHQIERKDNNGDYTPGNCIWATKLSQANNQSNNTRVTVGGETHTLAEWSRLRGINYDTISNRVHNLGWSYEDAVSKPVKRQGAMAPR